MRASTAARRSTSSEPAPSWPTYPPPQRVDVARRLGRRRAGGLHRLASTAVRRSPPSRTSSSRLAGVQWHPEVLHTEHGQQVLEHFLRRHRRLPPDLDDAQHRRGAGRGDPRADRRRPRRSAALSGGVDSAVAAAIVQRAIGDRLTCVYVDHGMMRHGETEQVERDFVAATGVSSTSSRPSEQFVECAGGVADPEEKRKIIGREFIRAFEAAEVRSSARRPRPARDGVPRPGHALPRRRGVRRRRRHLQHQVPPQRRRTPRRPPVRAGRAAAHALQGRGAPGRSSSSGCPSRSCGASRSPAPVSVSGSSARSPASAWTSSARPTPSPARSSPRAGLDRDIWQMPVVLLADVRSVGVQGDGRTYGHPVVSARSPPRTP